VHAIVARNFAAARWCLTYSAAQDGIGCLARDSRWGSTATTVVSTGAGGHARSVMTER
jgi:hypothetical protein